MEQLKVLDYSNVFIASYFTDDIQCSHANREHTLIYNSRVCWKSKNGEKRLCYVPAEKGLDYAANNYVIGSAQISAIRNNPDKPSSYPAIDPVDVAAGMCEKEPMQADGIVRLSKIEVDPDYLEEYMGFAMEVGKISLQTDPGVLTMYAVADKENPCNITILESYSSQLAYKKHIASPHFQKYKQGTLHMVKNLILDDVTPLNPDNKLINYILNR